MDASASRDPWGSLDRRLSPVSPWACSPLCEGRAAGTILRWGYERGRLVAAELTGAWAHRAPTWSLRGLVPAWRVRGTLSPLRRRVRRADPHVARLLVGVIRLRSGVVFVHHRERDSEARVLAQDRPTAAVPLTVAAAVEEYFARAALSANSERSYRVALGVVADAVGAERPLRDVPAGDVTAAAYAAWEHRAPATWNVRRNALRGFAAWAQRCGHTTEDLAGELRIRSMNREPAQAIPFAELEALWTAADVDMREGLLWHILYETAARCGEILGLNVEDIDMANRRAAVVGKGGRRELVVWGSGVDDPLAFYIGSRRRGPLFVAHKAAASPLLDDAEVCPYTGRRRLSYSQAWWLFKRRSGGHTLHQIRYSALTHLAEQGVPPALLQAKSRHRDIRTPVTSASQGADAVAEVTRLLAAPPR